MQKTLVEMPEILLAGICVRTSYKQELNKMEEKIFPCVQRYFHNALFEKIPKRKKPGVTFCAYTEYESDYTGAYTYFIGEEVHAFDSALPEEFKELSIPAGSYAKFTTPPGPMPDVVVNAWQAIWEMSEEEMGGKRRYQTDYEIYDERASDHQKIILDLVIGLETS